MSDARRDGAVKRGVRARPRSAGPTASAAEAIAKMERALSQFVVQGIETSIPLHQAVFRDAGFRAGEFDTKFMERLLAREVE